VLCCWVNGVSPGLIKQWSCWWVNQRSQSSSILVEGNKAFLAERGANRSRRFIELPEYAMGGRRGLIVIPEGCEGQGWRIFAAEMRKVVALFGSSLGAVPRHCSSGSPSAEVGGSSSGTMDKALVLGGGNKSFAEVVSKPGWRSLPSPLGRWVMQGLTLRGPLLWIRVASSGFLFADEAADEEERRGGMAFFGVLRIWRGQLEKIKELNQALRRVVEGWDAFGPEVPKAHSEVKIPVTRPKIQAVKMSCFK
jgi:hypothetical protein